jgi:hypothetical protein
VGYNRFRECSKIVIEGQFQRFEAVEAIRFSGRHFRFGISTLDNPAGKFFAGTKPVHYQFPDADAAFGPLSSSVQSESASLACTSDPEYSCQACVGQLEK